MVPNVLKDRDSFIFKSLDCLTLQMKAPWSTHPVTWYHIPEDLNPQLYHSKNPTSHTQYVQETKSFFLNMCTVHMAQAFGFYYSLTRIISKIRRHSWQKTGLLQEIVEQQRQLRLLTCTFTVTLIVIFSEEVWWNSTARVNVTWQNLLMNMTHAVKFQITSCNR